MAIRRPDAADAEARRDILMLGSLSAALDELAGRAQWVQSFVADDKTFCIYLAEDEAAVQEHARISGFPANKVTEVRGTIDPMTAHR